MRAAVECVAHVACTLGEGPVWDPENNRLFWVDIKAPALFAMSFATRSVRRWNMPEPLGAIGLRAKGGLVGAFRSGFAFIDLDTGDVTPIGNVTAHPPGNRFNDGHVDPRGRFWAGTMDDGERATTGHLFRLDPDRHVERYADRDDRRDLTADGLKKLEIALEAEGTKLREAAGRRSASILISVDQAEEMARAEGRSGEALADYLRVALAATSSPWQLAFTIRTDSFHELQSHRRFQNLEARGYDLRAIPVFRFDSVVEEPAKRYGVDVDSELVHALMEDAPKEDALPLLAFALQRLWRQYAAAGALTMDNYEKIGGLKGLIEDAAERALRGLEPDHDVPLPSAPPSKRLMKLAASTFVPALAQINDKGATIRQVAAWQSFEDEQQELLGRFDRWRLVVCKSADAEGGTVEVAHEALFREWGRLNGWLVPERARLEALRSLQTDAATWERNGNDLAFLNHRDKRLAEAIELAANESYAKRLSPLEVAYLDACRVEEQARVDQAAAQRHRLRLMALVAVLGISCIAVFAGWNWLDAKRQAQVVEHQRFQTFLALVISAVAKTKAGDKSLAAQDIEEAASLGQDVGRGFVQVGNALLEHKEYDEALVAYAEAVTWSLREAGSRETLAMALLGRGRTKDAKKRYAEAIADFRVAAGLGNPNAGGWLWWATLRLAEQNREAGAFVEAILISLPNYLDLTPEARASSNPIQLKSNSVGPTCLVGPTGHLKLRDDGN